jgi:hypothetical protein
VAINTPIRDHLRPKTDECASSAVVEENWKAGKGIERADSRKANAKGALHQVAATGLDRDVAPNPTLMGLTGGAGRQRGVRQRYPGVHITGAGAANCTQADAPCRAQYAHR